MKKLLVIDANSILNRAFYGIAPLSSPSGIPTNAVYGMINTVTAQLDAVQPDMCAAAFDVKAPTFRHNMYGEYKAGRKPAPPELLAQFPVAKDCLAAMGIYVAEKAGFEADDILGTLAAEAEGEDMQVYLLTGDRDSLQLITDKTTVLLCTNKETLVTDPAAFKEKYGVPAENYVYCKALMGDSSDNIPGVPGIGEKTAFKLIGEYGDLDTMYAALSDAAIPAGQKAKLEAGRELAYLSLELATIKRDAELGFGLKEVSEAKRDNARLASLFSELGFAKLTEKLSVKADKLEYTAPAKTEAVDAAELCAFADGKTAVFYVDADGMLVYCDGRYMSLSADEMKKADAFFGGGVKLVCHDLKAACHTVGRRIRGCIFDTMLADYILESGTSDHSLDAVCAKHPLGADTAIDYIVALWHDEERRLEENGNLKLLTDIEIPVCEILYTMEERGFLVDTEGLRKFGEKLTALAAELEARIYFLAGREFNINSPKQLGTVLFEEMGLKAPKKTKNGYSTASDVLDKLSHHEIVSLVLEYRHVTKLNSTFVCGLINAADEEGRVHTTFHQSVTATGRLSSTDPNLQNIPIRTELGREMRKFFVPKEGYLLADADYSQIELRVLAHVSGDAEMCRAFNEGADIHTSTAAAVFGVPEEMVTGELRKRAKAVNFGIVYGIGEFSLAEDLHISRKEAKEYIESYLARYSGVSAYLDAAVESARASGYVSTVFGRRRAIPELNSSNRNLQAFGERVAMNSPIQGSAADIIKIAMIRVFRRLETELPEARLLLQVHDELLLEAPKDKIAEAARILEEEMANAVSLSVPLPAECGTGENWFVCH
ncbi:MAG: DNA polymerase I [Clostridia bacterium]|nr:DNA polymerase I [Clostridia bacterium]